MRKILLVLMGIVGFIYARNLLLTKWREASVLKLQRAAHQIDMRLARVKDLRCRVYIKSDESFDFIIYLFIQSAIEAPLR